MGIRKAELLQLQFRPVHCGVCGGCNCSRAKVRSPISRPGLLRQAIKFLRSIFPCDFAALHINKTIRQTTEIIEPVFRYDDGFPWPFQKARVFRRSEMDAASRLEDGSSSTSTSGSMIDTPAQATFCFSPPERWKIFRSISFSNRKSRTVLSSRARIVSAGWPRFSQPKVISLVVSTLKTGNAGFGTRCPRFSPYHRAVVLTLQPR